MNQNHTPVSDRRHVAVVGRTNAGKSTLFNALLEQDAAIVSDHPGTTTDPVVKTMELIPYGPIALMDTAGLEDESALGPARARKTQDFLRRADAALFVARTDDFDRRLYELFVSRQIPHLLVFNQCGRLNAQSLDALRRAYPEAETVFEMTQEETVNLRTRLASLLTGLVTEETPALAHITRPGDTIALAVPIDAEAPKGRLILPQVQTIRQALDLELRCMVIRPRELADALNALPCISLVITDSQVFGEVAAVVPEATPLTSFSMLLAFAKGNFSQMLAGCAAIPILPDGARILMLEGCSHNKGHEDIGRVKIPALLQNRTGKTFCFDFYSGYDFPGDLSGYALAIQCGGCMINRREVDGRLKSLAQASVPVSNYGMVLAYGSGVLDRAARPFLRETP